MTKSQYPQSDALELARINAIRLLGLHEHNTAQDRAKAMGYDLEAFHGTDAPDIESLDPERTKIIKGVFSSTNPMVASTYAKGAAEKGRAGSKSAPNIIPLLLKSASHTKPHPAVSFNKNLIDSFKASRHKGVYSPESEVAVTFDPSQMRSRFAAFDPARAHEAGLSYADGGSTTDLDAMKLALMNKPLPKHERDANLAKFLEPSKEKRRMYHGTRQAKTRSVSKPGQEGISEFVHGLRGMTFVSPDTEFANSYAGRPDEEGMHRPAVYPMHVQVEHPFDYENPQHIENVLPHLPYGTDYKWSVVHGKTPEQMREALSSGLWELLEDKDVMDAVKHAGHDAMYMKEGKVKNLGVFDTRKLKSAIGNRGTYDTSNPDITMKRGGTIKDHITITERPL